MKYAEEIYTTLIPEYIEENHNTVFFPDIDDNIFEEIYCRPISRGSPLLEKCYIRRK